MGDRERGERADERIDVAVLLAKEAIREALYRELDAWRRRDWSQMRAGFTPDARIELALDAGPVSNAASGSVPGAALAASAESGASAPAPVGSSVEAQLGRLAEAMRGFVASSLLASNCRVEIGLGAAAARSSALILAAHEPPAERGERTRLEALRFSDHWIRDRAGEWKVARRSTESLWRAWLEPRRDDRAGDHRHAAEWER